MKSREILALGSGDEEGDLDDHMPAVARYGDTVNRLDFQCHDSIGSAQCQTFKLSTRIKAQSNV